VGRDRNATTASLGDLSSAWPSRRSLMAHRVVHALDSLNPAAARPATPHSRRAPCPCLLLEPSWSSCRCAMRALVEARPVGSCDQRVLDV
jgi:hypothetical protein